MPDADSSLKILIELGLVGEDEAERAKTALRQTGEEADKAMGVVRVSQEKVNEILGKGAGAHEGAAEKSELHGRSLRRLASLMGQEIPGAGALMEAGFQGAEDKMMGATFLLIAGVEMLKESIKKINEEREQSRKIAEQLAEVDRVSTKTTDAQREALEKAEVAEAEFHHNFVRNAQQAIDQATKLAEATLKAATAAGEGRDNTRKGIADKEVEDMEQRGVINHATALKMKEQLDIQYEQQKLQRMMAQDAVEQSLLANQLNNHQVATVSLTKNEEAAADKYKTIAQEKAANDAKIDEAQDKIKGAEQVKASLAATGVTDENIQKLQEAFRKSGGDPTKTSLSEQFNQQARQHLLWGTGMDVTNVFGSHGDVNLGTFESANSTEQGAKLDLNRGRARATDLDIEAGNAQSDLESARRELEKNRDQVRELQDQITQNAQTNAIKEGGAQQNLGMKRADDALVSDRGIADRVQGGGQVSDTDQQALIRDASRIAGHQVDLATAAQIIENGANNMGIFMNQVTRLATVLGKFTPADQANLQRQIDQLKAQMANAGNRSNNS